MIKPIKSLVIILVMFFVVAVSWNLIIPPYENLDELEHAEVVRHIVVTGKLPVHDAAEADGFNVRQEASQPPLYHLMAAIWANILDLPTNPHTPKPIPTDIVACGSSDTFYNKATWIHDPIQHGFPWSDSILTLHSLRIFSTILQMVTVTGVWVLAHRVFRKDWVPLMATVLVAFNPQFLLLSSGVNNDNIITPLATWVLVVISDEWNKESRSWRLLLLGTLCGLAGLSKLSGFGLLGLAEIVIIIRGWYKKIPFNRLLVHGLLILVPFLLLVSPWLIRNLHLYNDPTALTPMLEKVGYRRASITIGDIRLMFLSYWGQLPCSFYPRALYWPYIILVGGGFLGLLLGWQKIILRQKHVLGLCIAWFSIIVVAWIRWNSMTHATGGRLLFPAIAALALVLASGWWYLYPRVIRWWVIFLPVWSLIVLVTGPLHILAPPKPVKLMDSAAHPLNLTFGDNITLIGYKADIRKMQLACILISKSYCDPTLDLTLYWQTNAPVKSEETMVVQLVSPEPGNTTLRFNYNHWPGKGNYPTSSWLVNTPIRDHYLFPLPTYTLPTGAWIPQLSFVHPETGERLPVYLSGHYLGDAAHLGIIRVPGMTLDYPKWSNPATPVLLGDAIVLKDAAITLKQNSARFIDLLWESENLVTTDYTVFVHAYDKYGNLLVTGDAPPQNGGFPTSLWQPGDHIMDSHTLPITTTKTASIAVGLYDPISGERLSVIHSGTPLPNNAVIIWKSTD